MSFHRLLFGLILALALGTIVPYPARALTAAFNVNPIRVFLGKSAASATFSIENKNRETLRLEVRAYSWTDERNGKPVLAPTTDVIVFPTVLEIPPSRQRSVRIAYSGRIESKELTYRLAFDELPSLEGQLAKRAAPDNEILTRITVPVFIRPPAATAKAQIDRLTLAGGKVLVSISNQGNVHVTLASARIVGRDASGSAVLNEQIDGWYVLAGKTWDFQVPAGAACGKIRTLSVTVDSDVGRMSKAVEASAGAC